MRFLEHPNDAEVVGECWSMLSAIYNIRHWKDRILHVFRHSRGREIQWFTGEGHFENHAGVEPVPKSVLDHYWPIYETLWMSAHDGPATDNANAEIEETQSYEHETKNLH